MRYVSLLLTLVIVVGGYWVFFRAHQTPSSSDPVTAPFSTSSNPGSPGVSTDPRRPAAVGQASPSPAPGRYREALDRTQAVIRQVQAQRREADTP